MAVKRILSWTINSINQQQQDIQRSLNGGEFITIATLTPTDTVYIDTEDYVITTGSEYRVVSVGNINSTPVVAYSESNGIRPIFSDWVIINTPSRVGAIGKFNASKTNQYVTYESHANLDLTTAIVRSLRDADMQQWQAVKDAITQLTGKSSWTWDNTNDKINFAGGSNPPRGILRTQQFAIHADYEGGWKGPADDYGYYPYTGTDPSNIDNKQLENLCFNTFLGGYFYGSYCSSSMGGYIYARFRVESNPYYDPNYTAPTESITYQQIAQKIISNTSSSNQAISLLAEAYLDEVVNSINSSDETKRFVRLSDITPTLELNIFNFTPPTDLLTQYIEGHGIQIDWSSDGNAQKFNYYCSETAIDPSNLPAPKVVLTGDTRTYIDVNFDVDKTYYMALGSVRNGVEKVSAVVYVKTTGLSGQFVSFFANTVKGMAYNLKDLTTLWQDVAGTIPVTAVDQLVARVDDLSGNGNHLIQTDVARMPQLKKDIDGFYLWFDGTKTMYSVGAVDFNGLYEFTILNRFSKETVGDALLLESSVNFNSNQGGFAVAQDYDNIRMSTSGSGYNTAATALAPDSAFVGVVNIYETPKIRTLRINGEVGTITSSLNEANLPLASYPIYVGSRAGTNYFATTKLRSLAFVGRMLTNSEILDIEKLLMT